MLFRQFSRELQGEPVRVVELERDLACERPARGGILQRAFEHRHALA